MLIPSSFAIHVTYTCPLTCAHCCFLSSPLVKDRLPLELILETIRSLDCTQIRMVAFTGGEPFLLGRELVGAVQAAKARGMVTRIVTSAYFGKTEAEASKRLRQVREAGLDELSISWDDFHEEFVAFEAVRNVFMAAKELGLKVAVNVVQAKDSRWNVNRVRTELRLSDNSDEVFVESPINLTGRAELTASESDLREKRFLGPCPYVLTGPTLSAKGKLLACCGVIPETDALILDHDFAPENLSRAIEAGLRSPLLNWLYLRGPYEIASWISNRYGIPIRPRESVGGNCEACAMLFGTESLASMIPQALREKGAEIIGELELLTAIGWSDANYIQRLWGPESTWIDTSPRSVIQDS